MSDWSKNLGAFSFSKFAVGNDVVIGIFLMVVILLIAFGIGKTRMLLAILSTYVAFLIALSFPFYTYLKAVSSLGAWPFWPQLTVFWIGFFLAFFILNKSTLKSKMSLRGSSPLLILWLSIVETGFLVSVMLSYGQPEIPNFQLSPLLTSYFGTSTSRFVWALLPLVSIFFVKPSRRSSPVS